MSLGSERQTRSSKCERKQRQPRGHSHTYQQIVDYITMSQCLGAVARQKLGVCVLHLNSRNNSASASRALCSGGKKTENFVVDKYDAFQCPEALSG